MVTKTPQAPAPPIFWRVVAACAVAAGIVASIALSVRSDEPTRLVVAGPRAAAAERTLALLSSEPGQRGDWQPLSLRQWHILLLSDALSNGDGAGVEAQLVALAPYLPAAPPAPLPAPPATTAPVVIPTVPSVTVPILLYHRPPANFASQMQHLVDRGYHSITLDDLAAALTNRSPLPSKPVIITLDDGYRSQLDEIAVLRRLQLRATLYMIVGGEKSSWCIGANRHAGAACGEDYLSWDELRSLDREGLVTIGAHTVNHPDLAKLPPAEAWWEISESKRAIEAELGHPIYHFAYPYGSYKAETVTLARQAGFRTAVTVAPGETHTASSLFTLTRIRDTKDLL